MTLLEKSKKFAIKSHIDTNHTYDGKPYSIHLEECIEVANKFIYLIPEEKRDIVIGATYCHDVLEDCHIVSFNDMAQELSSEIAELVYAVTNEKGRNRKERQNERYYEGIRAIPFAVFVKLCDRIANITYSKQSGSPMFGKYVKEHIEFKNKLYQPQYNEMFKYMDELVHSKE